MSIKKNMWLPIGIITTAGAGAGGVGISSTILSYKVEVEKDKNNHQQAVIDRLDRTISELKTTLENNTYHLQNALQQIIFLNREIQRISNEKGVK